MQEQFITSRQGNLYRVESFRENSDTVGLGRSYSLSLRKFSPLPHVPEGTIYPMDEDNEPVLNFRFNLSDSTIRNFDQTVLGTGEQGYQRRIVDTLVNSVDDGTESLAQNDAGEYIVNL